MSEPLKPQFFVLRQNGSLVPLIPMDEIPHNIRIADVPRTLSIQETVGMLNIGQYPSRHRHFVLTDTNGTPNRFDAVQFLDTLEVNSDEERPSTTPTKQPVSLASITGRSYGIGEQPPTALDAPTSTTPSGPPSTSPFGGFEPLPPWHDPAQLGPRTIVPGKKIYCTHWMSTGECDYAQQGCLYKHVMPLDLKTLNDLGYQDIPKWYREKHGIGKLTATPGSGAAIVGPSMRSSVATRGTATATWNGFAGVNRSHGEQILTPSGAARRENSGRTPARRGPNNQTRQSRGQTDTTTSPELNTVRPNRATDSRRTSSNPLSQSRYAPSTQSSRHQLSPRPTSSRRIIHTSNNSTIFPPPSPPPSSHFHLSPSSARRRSSLYSDPEADIIRENERRKEKEDREYEVACTAARRAEKDEKLERRKRESEGAEMED